MACARYSDALNEAAAGGPVPEGLDTHLAGCARCRAELLLLRRALTVADQDMHLLSTAEPSAGFVPRVRAAVMESAAVPARRAGWLWPSLATAGVLVMALIVVLANRHPVETIAAGGQQPSTPAAPEAASAPAPESVRTPAVVGAAENDRATPPPQHREIEHRVATEPQVLVPAGERRILVEFIAFVNRERLAPAALVAASQPLAPLAAPSAIDIKPIEIVPLDTATNPGT